MTVFDALEPIALGIGYVVIAAILFIGLTFVLAVIGAVLTGLIPSRSVDDTAPPPLGTRLTAVSSAPAERVGSRDGRTRSAPPFSNVVPFRW